MKTVVDYVAEYLGNLPAEHPINVAFKERLIYDKEAGPHTNIWLYKFPFSEDQYTADIQGELVDVSLSNAVGVCIRPLPGGRLDPYSGKAYPQFTITVRHRAIGVAFNTGMDIIMDLSNNARVFPQNGVTRSLHTQPDTIWTGPQYEGAVQMVFTALMATLKI